MGHHCRQFGDGKPPASPSARVSVPRRFPRPVQKKLERGRVLPLARAKLFQMDGVLATRCSKGSRAIAACVTRLQGIADGSNTDRN